MLMLFVVSTAALFCLLFTASTVQACTAPPGYSLQHHQVYYKEVTTPTVWSEAAAACEADGARLPIMKSQEAYDTVHAFRGNITHHVLHGLLQPVQSSSLQQRILIGGTFLLGNIFVLYVPKYVC